MKSFAAKLNNKRVTAIAACFIIVVSITVMTSFVIEFSDHDCSGNDCPICALMLQFTETLRHIGNGTDASCSADAAAVFLVAGTVIVLAAAAGGTNLIEHKVRMDC